MKDKCIHEWEYIKTRRIMLTEIGLFYCKRCLKIVGKRLGRDD